MSNSTYNNVPVTVDEITNQSQAVIPTNSNSPVGYLFNVLRDPITKLAWSVAINPTTLGYSLHPTDIHQSINNGVVSYSLDPAIADANFTTFKRLGSIITCAATNNNPFQIDSPPLPLSIPNEAFEKLSMDPIHLPTILISYDVNPLGRNFPSIKILEEEILLMQHATAALINWIATGLQVALRQGAACEWNFGAFFGLSWDVFRGRIARAAGLPIQDSIMPTVVPPEDEYDMTSVERGMIFRMLPDDIDLNELVRRYCTRLTPRTFHDRSSRHTRSRRKHQMGTDSSPRHLDRKGNRKASRMNQRRGTTVPT